MTQNSHFIPRRLEKYLRDATALSVDEGRRALEQGRVSVSSADSASTSTTRLSPDHLVYAEDSVLLDREPLQVRQIHDYLMLNKPKAVTSTLRDPCKKRDLTAFLQAMPDGVFPVGRLDRDTTGLLLCTNDGDLANAVLHPDHGTDKGYWLWLNEHVPDDDSRLCSMLQGVTLHSYTARAAAVRVYHRSDDFTELVVTLRQGKNRQIRRMCRALDFHLQHLHRLSIGPLKLGPLAVGEFRRLTRDEVVALWEATGGVQRVARRKLLALQKRANDRRRRGEPDLRLEHWLNGPKARLSL